MKTFLKAVSVAATSLLLFVHHSLAMPLPKVTLGSVRPTMVESRQEPTPLGYVLFCMNNSSQCAGGGDGRLILDEVLWSKLDAVNHEINARITPDAAKGTTDWSLTTTLGNCNDYAVQKKAQLMARGVSPRALSLSVVVTPHGEGHLILTVRTDRGDFVLDNLRDNIVAWSNTGYRWVSVQSNVDQNRWVRVRGEKPTAFVKVREASVKRKPAVSTERTFSGAPAFILK